MGEFCGPHKRRQIRPRKSVEWARAPASRGGDSHAIHSERGTSGSSDWAQKPPFGLVHTSDAAPIRFEDFLARS
jgi:hypothetical protein